MIEMEVTFDNIANDFELRVSRERNLAGKHDVEDDAQGPDVNLRVVVLQEYLRCDVVWLTFDQKKRLEK